MRPCALLDGRVRAVRAAADGRRQAAGPGQAQGGRQGGREGQRQGTDAKDKKGPPTGKSIATRLQSCQDIDDQTKERLNCYDEVLKPAPKPKPGAAKTVMDCKFIKEEDERLTCYNGFVDSMPKMPKSS